MINKIVRILKQEQGFTLMELMIVVVILGILAGVAVPVYNGVQDRAKYAVGEANATLLNRGLRQLKELGYYDGSKLIEIPDTGYNRDKHEGLLMTFLGFKKDDEIEYVGWNSEDGTYDANIEEKITVSLEYDIPEETP